MAVVSNGNPLPRSFDELLRLRAVSHANVPIIGYPSAPFVYRIYTASELNTFAYRAACHIEKLLGPTAADKSRTVGLVGPSTIEYLVMILALMKLGLTPLVMSPRLADPAFQHLLTTAGCRHVFAHEQFREPMGRMAKLLPLRVHEIVTAQVYEQDDTQTSQEKDEERMLAARTQWADPELETDLPCWVNHSSGSTGLPKLVYYKHSSAVRILSGMPGDLRSLCTFPLFHAFGLYTAFAPIYWASQSYLMGASMPITGPNLRRCIEAAQPDSLYIVAYTLKLLADTPGGLADLQRCRYVMYTGAAVPKGLGDDLVRQDVRLYAIYGSTECGICMDSMRDFATDKDWDSLRPVPSFVPFMDMVLRKTSVRPIFELVVRAGWPSLSTANRADGGYSTSDLFEQLSDDNKKWRIVSRNDDTIILSNGENANPLPLEENVRMSPQVRECIVYGQGQPNLVMLVVPAVQVDNKERFVDEIWDLVARGNASMPGYAKMTKDAIRILSKDSAYASTDKGTAIRQQFYKQYMPAIDAIYNDLQSGSLPSGQTPSADLPALSLDETKKVIREAVSDILQLRDTRDFTDDADFFTLGLDSLQALHLRRRLVRALDTGGHPVGQNVAFENPTTNLLAEFLHQLRENGTDANGHDAATTTAAEFEKMQLLIDRYSDFPRRAPAGDDVGSSGDDGHHVVLTGATGFLGAHLAAQLALNPDVKKVYCLVRATSQDKARQRVHDSLGQRRLDAHLSSEQLGKLVALACDLGRPDLGISPPGTYTELTRTVTAVIHNAWAVNFNLGVTSFEAHHIRGTHNLLMLCAGSRRASPPSFSFASSISAVMLMGGGGSQQQVPEKLSESFADAIATGYGRSKLVAEHICAAAARKSGLDVRILRIGQLAGDTEHGLWNSKEAVPLTVQATGCTGALPKVKRNDLVSWLPINVAAQSMADIALSSRPVGADVAVFHVCMPHLISWNDSFLPALRAAGLEFETVDPGEWMRRLKREQDPEKNPAIKLLDYFEGQYGDESAAVEEPYFLTDSSCKVSPALASAMPIDGKLIAKFLGYWTERRTD